MKPLLPALLILVLTSSVAYADYVATLPVTISGSTVVVSGITPHGKAVFIGILHDRIGSRATVFRVDKAVADTDGDGIVTLESTAAIPYRSIFAVLDETTGNYGVATPIEFEQPPLLQSDPVVQQNGSYKLVIAGKPLLDMLVVRPGTGAWAKVLADGGSSDADGATDNSMRIEGGGSIIDGATALAGLQSGDSYVLIDPFYLTIRVGRVGVTQ